MGLQERGQSGARLLKIPQSKNANGVAFYSGHLPGKMVLPFAPVYEVNSSLSDFGKRSFARNDSRLEVYILHRIPNANQRAQNDLQTGDTLM